MKHQSCSTLMKHLGRYIKKKILVPGSSPSAPDVSWSAEWSEAPM